MKPQIKIVHIALDGHPIPVEIGLSELLSDVKYWGPEKPVESNFLKNYSRLVERNENGSLVTVYEKKSINEIKKIAQ